MHVFWLLAMQQIITEPSSLQFLVLLAIIFYFAHSVIGQELRKDLTQQLSFGVCRSASIRCWPGCSDLQALWVCFQFGSLTWLAVDSGCQLKLSRAVTQNTHTRALQYDSFKLLMWHLVELPQNKHLRRIRWKLLGHF